MSYIAEDKMTRAVVIGLCLAVVVIVAVTWVVVKLVG